ncbi:Branched-chain amino acid transport protein AzlD [Georgenia satyanarayanai]|uniref:Branched-chain amino acid transport protein AzlD n=1 Tax=Georgenia satyanarayanai TaxID=860221 RepID=A0A2Y9AFK1_9MICO|nr:AzlD domain-containing protein [Georgenia satyanarayanai]PYF99126.1 branched-subunit amino acid transport protein AzlD [Georgenia satyanarayanai]SSA43244.1 Branched-chain amino acid transport protein AzlD [Georgenia satyanarayanai]
MPEPGYVVAALATVFVITLALRAVPFAILEPLRDSRLVMTMAAWMPAGILAVLAAATFRSSATGGHLLHAALAAAVTVAVHLTGGRRTLLSVGAGTLTYVALVNLT